MIEVLDARLAQARERLDAQFAEAARARSELDASVTELRGLTATVRSPRGECAVTADAAGGIVAIDLSEKQSAGPALAATLVRTIDRAQRDARELAADRAASLFGENSPLAQSLRHGPVQE